MDLAHRLAIGRVERAAAIIDEPYLHAMQRRADGAGAAVTVGAR
jgi:hypothetical protein